MVYIRESHAADHYESWDKPPNGRLIYEHTNHGERCAAADLLLEDTRLTVPVIVDDMNNGVAAAYSAAPSRIFVIRSDGRFAIAGEPGPWGLEPAIAELHDWLKRFKAQGVEPKLPDHAAQPGEELHIDSTLDSEDGNKAAGNG